MMRRRVVGESLVAVRTPGDLYVRALVLNPPLTLHVW